MAQESTTMVVWRFIAGFVRENGFSPSRKEIAAGCYISGSAVARHLYKLEGMGVLEIRDRQTRSIKVVEQPPPH